jgi:hypothetical protein
MRSRKLGADDHANLQSKVFEGATAAQFAEFAHGVLIVEQERSIRSDMFALIDGPDALDPVKAAQAWIELRAAYKLVARLEKIKKAGVAAQQAIDRSTTKAE